MPLGKHPYRERARGVKRGRGDKRGIPVAVRCSLTRTEMSWAAIPSAVDEHTRSRSVMSFSRSLTLFSSLDASLGRW